MGWIAVSFAILGLSLLALYLYRLGDPDKWLP